ERPLSADHARDAQAEPVEPALPGRARRSGAWAVPVEPAPRVGRCRARLRSLAAAGNPRRAAAPGASAAGVDQRRGAELAPGGRLRVAAVRGIFRDVRVRPGGAARSILRAPRAARGLVAVLRVVERLVDGPVRPEADGPPAPRVAEGREEPVHRGAAAAGTDRAAVLQRSRAAAQGDPVISEELRRRV